MSPSTHRSPRTTIQLRAWQQEAFGVYRDAIHRGQRSILWEATPGAGKTTAALAICLHQVRRLRAPTVLVVVPTAHLKVQWARAANQVGLNLDCGLTKDGAPRPRDIHGFVVTYQQLAQDPTFFRTIARQSCTVLDEIHHAGDGLSWGDAITFALAEARFVLCLSGTPFRSDNAAIPFVHYDDAGMSTADYSYGYARAVEEGVCRPTAFLTYGGAVSWRDGEEAVTATFSEPLDPIGSARRLRAAVSAESGWITPVFSDAHQLLMATRQHTPTAGGLVVASSQTQARKLSRILSRIAGVAPVLVLSEDSAASDNLKRFRDSDTPWLVACNMVSEGVDIPRLQVGIYATTVRTKMYFRQFIGRLVRSSQPPAPSTGSANSSSPVSSPIAYCYLPADPTLKQLAFEIETEIKHSIRHRDDDEQFPERDERVLREAPPETTWEILDSTNNGLQSVIVHGTALNGNSVNGTVMNGALLQAGEVIPNPISSFNSVYEQTSNGKSTNQLPHVESPLARHLELQTIIQEQVSERLTQKRAPTETKAALTREIRRLVTVCNRRLNRSHAAIYGQLNALQGIASQHSCSEAELRKRIALLNNMLRGA